MLNFFRNYRRDRFLRELRIIEERSPPAVVRGEEKCCSSGACCWRRPGALSLEDVPRMAAFLGLSPEQLFRDYLVVDDVGEGLCLLPRRAHQEGGVMISLEETYSLRTPCVFLDVAAENKCKVHAVKPVKCREFECWKPDRDDPKTAVVSREDLLALGWDGSNL